VLTCVLWHLKCVSHCQPRSRPVSEIPFPAPPLAPPPRYCQGRGWPCACFCLREYATGNPLLLLESMITVCPQNLQNLQLSNLNHLFPCSNKTLS